MHFPRTSFDLIYARPGQTLASWRKELAAALAHARGHLSLYQLTIEPATAFAEAHARGDLILPEEGTAAALYEATQEMLEAAGLPAYEISNHAAPGEESRHNLTYWRYGDYVGVGPGAHGRLTIAGEKRATRQHRAPEAWLERVESHGHATRQKLALSPEECREELLMMGLRLAEGVSRERFLKTCGMALEDGAQARAARAAGGRRLSRARRARPARDRGRPAAAQCGAGGAHRVVPRVEATGSRSSSGRGSPPWARRAAPRARPGRARSSRPRGSGRCRRAR